MATIDDAFDASLSLANGGLALENSHVAVATFTPAKAFGASAYGPLKYRVNAKGVAGDWQPLANLVRLPMLKKLDCPATPELACKLTGSSLYLIDSVSADAQFTKPVMVPDGFLGSAMPVPHPLTRHAVRQASRQSADRQSDGADRAGPPADHRGDEPNRGASVRSHLGHGRPASRQCRPPELAAGLEPVDPPELAAGLEPVDPPELAAGLEPVDPLERAGTLELTGTLEPAAALESAATLEHAAVILEHTAAS